MQGNKAKKKKKKNPSLQLPVSVKVSFFISLKWLYLLARLACCNSWGRKELNTTEQLI